MFNDLIKYDLPMPTMRFNAKPIAPNSALARSVGTLAGLQDFSRENLIAKIEGVHGKFDASIDVERIAFWRALISNSSIDSYFTRMAKSSLKYYSADSGNPTVSFQNSHRHDEFGVGRSVIGQLIETGTPPADMTADEYFPAVVTDFYSHRDLQLGDVSVEQFLLGVNTYIVKDVSIGFKENYGLEAATNPFQYTCNICRQDYFGWDCRHIAGAMYEMGESADSDPTDSEESREVMCVAWVENARLSEVSAVYDGANTNAMILKAEREARAGRLDADVKTYLERRFRFRRSDSKLWTGAEFIDSKPDEAEARANKEAATGKTEGAEKNKKVRTNKMDGDEKTETTNTFEVLISPKLRETARNMGLEVKEQTAQELVNEISSRAAALTTKANAYDKLREQSIETVIKERIAAEGEKFDATKQAGVRSMLGNFEKVEDILEYGEPWRTAADERFSQGRKTDDAKDEDTSKVTEETLPESTRKLLNTGLFS